jgi:hypothetical protein
MPPMPRPPFAPCTLLLALFLAGCSDEAVLQPKWVVSGFTPGEQGYMGAEMPVLVRGNPFAVPQAEFDTAVTDAMTGWEFGPQFRFNAAGNPNGAYRALVMFNPGNYTGETLCQRPLTAAPLFGVAPAPRVPVAAALCRGDAPVTYVYGAIPAQDGPRGPLFRRGVGLVTQQIFPSSNPQDRPGCPRTSC